MDIFDREILKFWKALQNNNVRYILIGGYATNLHGFQCYTGDMDIWIENTKSNREDLRRAFADCGMGDYFIPDTIQFVPGRTDFHLMMAYD